uniref:Uncharacterized protein n=1 Tax=Oryza glumipatula TaxID=40148 RepID=A0A0D9Z405_9ORYZ
MPPISRLDPRYHRARGLHELNRLMSLRREQRRLQIETYQFLAQCAKRKESPCQQDNSQCVKRMRYSGPDLPEDIWHHIHSLLPLQDAARAACVSQAFLRFWRCHPNLIFSWKTMGLNKVPHKKGGIVRDYNNKVDRIMKNHSGVSVMLVLSFRLVCQILKLLMSFRLVRWWIHQLALANSSTLRYLRITFATWRFSWAYDYFSLASFLDASPSLETFILCISQKEKHDLTFKDPICLRQIPEHRHDKLKNVKITGFSATRSLVELICHIMENTTSLECLTLDTLCTQLRCSDGNIDVCLPLDQDVIKGVHNSLLAIRTYIEGKIPSTVKFNVREPCSRCHGWIGARYTGWLRPFIGARREQGTVVIGDRVG